MEALKLKVSAKIEEIKAKNKERKNKGINNKNTNTSENQSHAINQLSCTPENNAATANAIIVTEESHSQENK